MGCREFLVKLQGNCAPVAGSFLRAVGKFLQRAGMARMRLFGSAYSASKLLCGEGVPAGQGRRAQSGWTSNELAPNVDANAGRVVGSADELYAGCFKRSLNFKQCSRISARNPGLPLN